MDTQGQSMDSQQSSTETVIGASADSSPKDTRPTEVKIFECGTVLGSVSQDESGISVCDNVLSESQSLLPTANAHDVRSLAHAISDSNMLENSIYSELNTSTCSRDSRQSKRSRRKQLKKCPPQYAAIFLDANHPNGATVLQTNGPMGQMGQFDGIRAVPVSAAHRPHTSSDATRGCCRLFNRPSLPFVIGILALGGVACTLGGIVLGFTGLIEHSTQYLSAALLMIGIGVSLLVIAGAIWRLSLPDDVDECPCFRHMEACRNCNSPYCNNRLIPGGYHFYPEFQHRPPPPTYVTSLNECALGLLFQHDMPGTFQGNSIRIATPPPLYRSTNSLSIFLPVNALSETTSHRNLGSVMENAVMSTVENPSNKDPTVIEVD